MKLSSSLSQNIEEAAQRRMGPTATSIALKVRGGTVRSDVDLCVTCSHATIIKGRENQLHKECGQCYNMTRVRGWPFAVTDCSDYREKGQVGLADMRQIAWHINADGPAEKIGFGHSKKITIISPEERRKKKESDDDGLPYVDD